jgi:hypothetical protein
MPSAGGIESSEMRIAKFWRVATKMVLGVVLFAVIGITVLLGVLWLDRTSETTLPTPTGSFVVGRTMYVWSDSVHADAMTPLPGTRRELLAWIWHPGAGNQGPRNAGNSWLCSFSKRTSGA